MPDPATALDPTPAPVEVTPTATALDPAPAPSADPTPAPASEGSPAPQPRVQVDPGAPSGDYSPTPTGNYFEKLPDNWREDLAGGDAKAAKMLERVKDMPTFMANYMNAQEKIRSGEISSGLPENATEEQMADWRVANGVPEEAKGYELDLAEGLVLGDTENRILEGVFESAHKHNVSVDAMSEVVSSFLEGQLREDEATIAQDGLDVQETTRLLREQWGGDYDTNLNLINGMLTKLPEESRELLKLGSLSSGKGLFNDANIMNFFAGLAREINPGGVVMPESTNQSKDIKTEIAGFEARMSEDGWHKDEAANARLLELYEAEEKMEAR